MIWASRIPVVILMCLPVAVYLFVFELYHVERLSERLTITNAVDAFPLLFFAMWKTLLFQATILAFASFWMTVDSQYGMIRVACAQPVTRLEYLVAKTAGVTAHVGVFTVTLIASLGAWAALYSGTSGIGRPEIGAFSRFSAELIVLVVALTTVAAAAASVRRTVGSGMVTATLGFIVLASMTMLPFSVVSPRLVLMRYFFFPVGEFANPYPAADVPFVRVFTVADFYRVALITTLVFALPAVLYFRKRDIVE